MMVADLRQWLVARVDEAAEGGDEMAIASVLAYSRAVLIALARQPADGDVDVEELQVGTATAATILGLHPEYVRYLVRYEKLRATKENGELRIPLSEIVAFSGEREKRHVQSTLGGLDLMTRIQSSADPGRTR